MFCLFVENCAFGQDLEIPCYIGVGYIEIPPEGQSIDPLDNQMTMK
jgi:hypothetical protein